jgi:hypothetical protein
MIETTEPKHHLIRRPLVICLVLVGCPLFLLILFIMKSDPPIPDLWITSPPQATNGGLLISLMISNRSSRALNIVDDASGNPCIVLDQGPAANVPGTIGTGLGPKLANTLKLNLAPGTSLMTTATVTNPPPRFRLLVQIRDPATENRRAVRALLNFLAQKMVLGKPTPDGLILLPATPWIVGGIVETPTQEAAKE